MTTNTATNVVRGQAGLPGLVIEIDLPLKELRTLRSEHNLSLYRFETIHLAQREPARSPFFAFRGDEIVPESKVDKKSIRALAQGIAEHLWNNTWPGEEPFGLLGDYDPVAEQHDPPLASPMFQALGALALARYAQSPGLDDATRQTYMDRAAQLLIDVHTIGKGEDDPYATPTSCAAIVCAALEAPALQQHEAIGTLLDSAATTVLNTLQRDEAGNDVFRKPTVEKKQSNTRDTKSQQSGKQNSVDRTIAPHGRALLAWAFTRLAAHERTDIEMAQRAVQAAWKDVTPDQAVILLPWIGWAEIELAEHTGGPMPHGEKIDTVIEALDNARLDRSAPGDLVGGLPLRRGKSRRRLADTQTLRPAAFMATAVRESRLTPSDQRWSALGRHLRTMRFVMQLQMTEHDLWRVRGVDAARGGLRNAAWDLSQPVAAQCMGLLTAVETLRTLHALETGHGGQ